MSMPMLEQVRRSPEVELVLLAARPGSAPEDDERMRELMAGELDWDRLVAYAGWHRVLPVVHATLDWVGGGVMPEPAQHRFVANATATLQTNLLISGELARIVRLCAEHDIVVVPLKGPVLSVQAYGNLALRPCTDLDLLVRPEDAGFVQELLLAAGYQPVVPLTPAQEQAYFRYEHDRAFIRRANGVLLELHWRFFARYVAFALDLNRLWGSLGQLVVAGVKVPVLPAEEMLVFLALHGAKHRWSSLGWVLDIARLPGSVPGFNWERVRLLARETGTERALALALALADALWGMPLPPSVRVAVAGDAAAHRLARQVLPGLADLGKSMVPPAEEHRFYLASRERAGDRFWYYWLWMFTPNLRDQTLLPLPAWLSPLHYLIRPVRIAAALFRRALRR